MIALEDFQRDAISELLNIGMGRAAASLSEMVGESLDLSVPRVEFLTHAQAIEHINAEIGSQVTAIRESFSGSFWGDALLLFPEDQSLALVRALLKDENLPLDALSEMEQEALTEVGNIVLNACLGSLSNVFKQSLDFRLPEFTQGAFEKVLQSSEASQKSSDGLLLVQMDFSLHETKVNGYMILLMDLDSLQAFTDELKKYFDQHA